MVEIAIAVLGALLSLSALAQTAQIRDASPPQGAPASESTPSHSQLAAANSSRTPAESIRFRDISREAGLTTVPQTTTAREYILDTMSGGGVALFDCDNDGRLDIAVVNDSTIARYKAGGDLMVTLYKQDGKPGAIHFSDVTRSSGLLTKGYATGIAVADFDNDGLPDLYITGYGHNVLYRNLGDCKFEDVTRKAGLEVGGFSTGAAWADYDRDGHVDLFVARYIKTDAFHLPPDTSFAYKGVLVQLPDSMEGESDFLFRNRGDGTFEDVSAKAGVSDPQKLHGMGVAWGDYDGDGWPDLFVTNDGGYNYLYHNLKNGTFEELGFMSGTAAGDSGQIYGNMAADFGDIDRDGKLDLFVTRYGNQPASLYWNRGNGDFVDIAPRTGIAGKTFTPIKWGVGFGDFDNDGWEDILMVSGNFSSLLGALPTEPPFQEPIQLYHNEGNLAFKEIANQAGLNDGTMYSRRGTAFGDINNDGNLDVVVFNVGAPPSLFLNETQNGNHRALIHLIGVKSNRMAIGARVTVTTASATQTEEVRAGSSYLSTSDFRLHFGLGTDDVMKTVRIQWPSGVVQEFHDVKADAIYEVKEGQGIRKIASFQK